MPSSGFCRTWFVILAIIFGLHSPLYAQSARFRSFNPEAMRPNPPTMVRVDSSEPSGTTVGAPPYRPPYQEILDGLLSPQGTVREEAAHRMYDQRNNYAFVIEDFIKFLDDPDVTVVQFVSSVILTQVIEKPYRKTSLVPHVPVLERTFRRTNDQYVRGNCLGLLALAASDFTPVQPFVADAIGKGRPIEVINAVMAVQYFAPPSIEIYKALASYLGKEAPYAALEAVDAMTRVAAALRSSSERYYADRLLDGVRPIQIFGVYDAQIAFIRESAAQIRRNAISDGVVGLSSAPNNVFRLEGSFDYSLFDAPAVKINGDESVRVLPANERTAVRYLGPRNPFHDGLNTIRTANVTIQLWLENKILRNFVSPYKRSYAIVVAIDSYGTSGGSASTKSQYKPLGGMVANAAALIDELKVNGFPTENIFFLTDGRATSKAVEQLLQEFWSGGRYEEADRLLVYFGGHGDFIDRPVAGRDMPEHVGFLITADFDSKRPTASSLLMRDLTGRHFENIVSNHVLVLIDSCSAGLALPRFQNSDAERGDLAKFRQLVTISTEVKRPARNVLVAGTGAQDALWENGGIFTESVIEGIRGAADLNRDRLVEFDELALFVKDSVRGRAASTGVEQEPAAFKASSYGNGSVLFIRDEPVIVH